MGCEVLQSILRRLQEKRKRTPDILLSIRRQTVIPKGTGLCGNRWLCLHILDLFVYITLCCFPAVGGMVIRHTLWKLRLWSRKLFLFLCLLMKEMTMTRRRAPANDPPIAPPSTCADGPLVFAACFIMFVELAWGPRRLVETATVLIANVTEIIRA
jgi:hypothetical protein